MKYLQLIRFPNLLMIAVVQCIVKYAFFEPLEAETSMNTTSFLLLLGATVFIAAGGYIVNDIYDIVADNVNKPNKQHIGTWISEKRAFAMYYLLTISGVALGFILANRLQMNMLFPLFIFMAVLLLVYASHLKRIALLGNLMVSFCIGFSVLIVGIFDLIGFQHMEVSSMNYLVLKYLLHYALLAFLLNFLRELVKDLQDVKGDHSAGFKTLPIILGIQRTTKLTAVLSCATIAFIVVYALNIFRLVPVIKGYFMMGIVLPLGITTYMLWNASNKDDFKKISTWFKVIMLLGMLFLPLLTYHNLHAY